MRRQAFLLGLFSIGGQVLLLREIISSFNGDELFIGTALFGWLISVAIGAYLGGKKRRVNTTILFIIGAALVPITIIAVRLFPAFLSPVVGEIVPFGKAAMVSIIAMFPAGLISGWLFSAVSNQGIDPGESIVIVYLFEGIGAFVGGIVITIIAGSLLSTLGLALVFSIVITTMSLTSEKLSNIILSSIIGIAALFPVVISAPIIDRMCDVLKYDGYSVISSFDTPYGHQAILEKDSHFVLMTDNAIEDVYPDIERYENNFIPPMIYNSDAKNILFIGRGEFYSLVDTSQVTFLDPRDEIGRQLSEINIITSGTKTISNDPLKYFSRHDGITHYDIIILNPGMLDSYKSSRMLTTENIIKIKTWLKEDGVLHIPTGYDTDRYISPEKKPVLSAIYKTLEQSFNHINIWPGTMTLYFASDADRITISPDSVMSLSVSLGYQPKIINPEYLHDRLDEMKTERVMQAAGKFEKFNSLEKPILTHYQTMYRSTTHEFDRILIHGILTNHSWMYAIPILILAFFFMSRLTYNNRNGFPLFLYFTAGAVSLSFELLSFYLYQSTAGSLYSEIAVLIGTFMFGLAVGTWYAHRQDVRMRIEQSALLLLLAAAIMFLSLYQNVGPHEAIYFHICFLFVTALGTGTLFVGATNRYYAIYLDNNRGAGYAVEIAGSAAAALLTTTILLPIIGVMWLILSLAGLLMLAIVGTLRR
ncbi:MAG: hypothetical protein ABIE07_11440 [Candidatus Zixiibacteriota bacterium]